MTLKGIFNHSEVPNMVHSVVEVKQRSCFAAEMIQCGNYKQWYHFGLCVVVIVKRNLKQSQSGFVKVANQDELQVTSVTMCRGVLPFSNWMNALWQKKMQKQSNLIQSG